MSLAIRSKLDATQPFHIYYDIDILNNDQAHGLPSPNLNYSEARTNPILNCPSNYFASIVRFSLETPSLPIFIPQIKIGGSANDTIYTIYMKNTGSSTVHAEDVTYIPSNSTLVVSPPSSVQDLSNEYYFVYTYQQWINMLNQTLHDLAVTQFGETNAPFFQFDTTTSLLKFYVPASYGTTYQFFVNNQLQTLLDSFQFNYTNINSLYGNQWQLLYSNQNYLNNVTLNSVAYWVMYQESTTIPLLNPIQSLIFTCSFLPIVASLTAPPKVFGADASLFSTGNNANITPIITDFEVNLSNTDTYKEIVVYNPTAEYRLIDMQSSYPVNQIDISVYWKDIYGVLHPFKLNSGCTCSIKLMFRRKDYNNVDLPINQL